MRIRHVKVKAAWLLPALGAPAHAERWGIPPGILRGSVRPEDNRTGSGRGHTFQGKRAYRA